MGVRGAVLAGVSDADVLAVAAVALGDLHFAGARGVDRRAGRRGEVDALVHAVVAQDRMPAHAEPRRQAGAIDRGAHQELAQALAGTVEVGDAPVGQLEAVAFEQAAVDRERRIQQVAAAHDLGAVLERDRLEQRLEPVALTHVTLEIDVPAEQLDQADRDITRQSGTLGGQVQTVVDDAGPMLQARRWGLATLALA